MCYFVEFVCESVGRGIVRRFEGQFWIVTGCHSEFEVFTAHGLVGLVAANFDLGTMFDDATKSVEAEDHCGLAATVANGLDFGQIVGPGKQVPAALKELALEVRTQSVTKDWNVVVVGDIAELLDLFADQELGLVDQDTMQRVFCEDRFDDGQQVVDGRKRCGFRGESYS